MACFAYSWTASDSRRTDDSTEPAFSAIVSRGEPSVSLSAATVIIIKSDAVAD